MNLSINTGDNKKTTISYRTENKDGSTKNIEVEEVENGFLITVNTYTPSSGKEDKYVDSKYECKKFISQTNPFAQEATANMTLADIVSNLM